VGLEDIQNEIDKYINMHNCNKTSRDLTIAKKVAAMWKITVFITIIIVINGILPASSQLPCNSQLRTIRPELFRHCSTCSYSQWSSWKIIDKAVSTTCPSKKAFKQIRTRHDLLSSCNQQSQTRHTCKDKYSIPS